MNGQRPDWAGKLWHIQGLRPQGPSPEAQVGRAVEWLAARAHARHWDLHIALGLQRPRWMVNFEQGESADSRALGMGDTLEEALFTACVAEANRGEDAPAHA